jgi:hypothetical protein
MSLHPVEDVGVSPLFYLDGRVINSFSLEILFYFIFLLKTTRVQALVGEVAFSKGGRRAACLLPLGMSTEDQFTTYFCPLLFFCLFGQAPSR